MVHQKLLVFECPQEFSIPEVVRPGSSSAKLTPMSETSSF